MEDVTISHVLPWESLFPNTLRVELESGDAKKLHTGDVKSLRNQLKQIVTGGDESGVAIYLDRESQKPLGLLRNVHGMWEIGVNVDN